MSIIRFIRNYFSNTRRILHSYDNPLKKSGNERAKNALEKEFYDAEAQQYLNDFDEELFAYNPNEKYPAGFKRFYDLAAEADGKRVLDCGSGDGFTSVKAAKHGAVSYGIDVSPEMIRLAGKHAAFNNVSEQTSFNLMSAENLAFKNETFDMVLGVSSLHHLSLNTAGRELARVLKPGGRAIFVEPRIPYKPLILLRSLFPNKCHESPGGSQLSDTDIALFARNFKKYSVEHFVLLAKLSRLPFIGHFTDHLEILDGLLLRRFPVLRKLSWSVVLIFTK